MALRAPWWSALLLVWASGCGASDPPAAPPAEPPLHLLAEPRAVSIQPSQSAGVTFRLLDERDRPVPDRVVQFSIVDDPRTPENDARGATLSFDRAVSDSAGAVTVQITAGPQPTTFAVRASATRAPALEIPVTVTQATLAPVELAPVLVDRPIPGQELTTVRLHVLDGQGCVDLRRDELPATGPFVRTIPADSSALFSTVTVDEPHLLVALGLDAAGVVRASGCVDLPRSVLLVDVPLRVLIPMRLFRPAPEGSYEVVSQSQLGRALTGGAALVEAWREPGLCPLDPARLWLDCTIDAFKTSAGDPSDCRPAEDEGETGVKLLARRGVPLGTPAGGRCRDKVDAGGRASLDALAAELFPAARPPLMEGLPRLGDEVAQLLEAMRLRSVLSISPSSTREQYQVAHRLVSVTFPLARPVTIELVGIGVPALEARFVRALVRPSGLELVAHGFTLRLGSTARLAFGQTSLAPRGAPADATAFVTTLVGLATRDVGGTILTACAALDAVLCADLGQPPGSAMSACAEGLTVMHQRLHAGFQAMDGDDLDFVFAGTAAVLDGDGDGQADALGGAAGGQWSGEVRGRGGPSQLTGTWSAVRMQ